MLFTGKDDGHNIEDYIAYKKKEWPQSWKSTLYTYLSDEKQLQSTSSICKAMYQLLDEDYENIYLGTWSHVKNKDQRGHNNLLSYDIIY